jgi:dTDP-6-deoxy-L-lyxo-4-hexulose reductase RmlD-like protein
MKAINQVNSRYSRLVTAYALIVRGKCNSDADTSWAGGCSLTSFGRAELDFSDADAIRKAVRTAQPEIVINAAAYTAVDKAEQELPRLVNAVAPELIPIPTEAYSDVGAQA